MTKTGEDAVKVENATVTVKAAASAAEADAIKALATVKTVELAADAEVTEETVKAAIKTAAEAAIADVASLNGYEVAVAITGFNADTVLTTPVTVTYTLTKAEATEIIVENSSVTVTKALTPAEKLAADKKLITDGWPEGGLEVDDLTADNAAAVKTEAEKLIANSENGTTVESAEKDATDNADGTKYTITLKNGEATDTVAVTVKEKVAPSTPAEKLAADKKLITDGWPEGGLEVDDLTADNAAAVKTEAEKLIANSENGTTVESAEKDATDNADGTKYTITLKNGEATDTVAVTVKEKVSGGSQG